MSNTETAGDTDIMSEGETGRLVVEGRACRETRSKDRLKRKEPPTQNTDGHSTTKKYRSRIDDLSYQALHLASAYLTAEEVKKSIKELQVEVNSLKKSTSKAAGCVGGGLKGVPKLRECSTPFEKESIVFEVRTCILRDGQIIGFMI
ncbi:MAG: hypothetical protein M1839_002085 [Geoglossum umbratile]|nr:MAG: hypothetical protein M1839_002085 [Geoglossum umbratile]